MYVCELMGEVGGGSEGLESRFAAKIEARGLRNQPHRTPPKGRQTPNRALTRTQPCRHPHALTLTPGHAVQATGAAVQEAWLVGAEQSAFAFPPDMSRIPAGSINKQAAHWCVCGGCVCA